MNTEKQTASQAYSQRLRETEALLDWLGQELKQEKDKAKDWADVGSLGHVEEKLIEILAFYSPIDEADIRDALSDLK